jgi:hypothetical protein
MKCNITFAGTAEIEMLSLCTSIPIYFLSFNMRVLLSVGVDANDQNLLQRGALLYYVLSECGFLTRTGIGPVYEYRVYQAASWLRYAPVQKFGLRSNSKTLMQ